MKSSGPDPKRRARASFRLRGVLLWIAGVVALLVGADLAERFILYDIRERDRRSIPRMVRRPIKDTGLTLLHGLSPRPSVPDGVPVWDFILKPDDAALLRSNIARVQLIGTHDPVTREWIPARMWVDGTLHDVRIKLRGRQHYHVVAPRPSLRVQVRRGLTWRGARVFNLVEPFDKSGDLTFLFESAEHDMIGWGSTMGVVAFDGEPWMVAHYVEQPRRGTGDRNGRPEGMFFRGTGEVYDEGGGPGALRSGRRARHLVAGGHHDQPGLRVHEGAPGPGASPLVHGPQRVQRRRARLRELQHEGLLRPRVPEGGVPHLGHALR